MFLTGKTVNDVTLKPLYFEVPQSAEECFFLYRDWIFQEIYEVYDKAITSLIMVSNFFVLFHQ